MEPGPQGVAHPERPGLADQHQERGLEGILGMMRIAEDGQADAPDHRAMPLHQRGEGQLGHLVRIGREPLQELPVGQFPDRPHVVENAKLPQDGPVSSIEHHGDDSSANQPAHRRPLTDPVSVPSS